MNEQSVETFLPVWEDLVNDFLEMACFMNGEERDFLIRELQRKGVETDCIRVFPSFSIDGRIIVICEEEEIKECWMYYPGRGRLIIKA